MKNTCISLKALYLTKKALLMLYHAYIIPYMTYCIEVWGCTSQTQQNSIV